MKKETFVRRIWLIDGYPEYFVGDDNKMYRIKKETNVRACKLTQIGYSQGYVLKSRFFTLNRLRSMLLKNEHADPEMLFLIIKDKLP